VRQNAGRELSNVRTPLKEDAMAEQVLIFGKDT